MAKITNEELHKELVAIRELLQLKDRVMNVRECAEYLHIKPQTLYQYTCLGKIPCYKSEGGRKMTFRQSEVDKWRMSRRVASNAELRERAVEV